MSILKSLIESIEQEGPSRKEQAMDYESGDKARSASAQESRAATVGLADFSEQLTAGVLRAIDAQTATRGDRPTKPGDPGWPPIIWCGIWVRPADPVFDVSLATDAVKHG